MDEAKLLERITVNPNIFGGKPIIRGRRLAVEQVLGMLAAGDSPEILLQGYPWLEKEDVQAFLVHARRRFAGSHLNHRAGFSGIVATSCQLVRLLSSRQAGSLSPRCR